MSQPHFSQSEMLEKFAPLLQREGILYKKFKKVLAMQAHGGEKIETVTADGKETQNTARAGDFIVKNQTEAGERYVVPKEKFEQKYEWLEKGHGNYDIYLPSGKAIAIELTEEFLKLHELPEIFHFQAAWHQQMVIKKGDFLVAPPDCSEVYRIARQEFFETYQ